ncbi:MAG: Na-translocating system protein MpsC family protein, partial [Fibrobacterota bacterium]
MLKEYNHINNNTEAVSIRIAEEICSYGSEQIGIRPEKISVDVHEQSVTVTLEGVSHPAELNLAKQQLSRSMI